VVPVQVEFCLLKSVTLGLFLVQRQFLIPWLRVPAGISRIIPRSLDVLKRLLYYRIVGLTINARKCPRIARLA